MKKAKSFIFLLAQGDYSTRLLQCDGYIATRMVIGIYETHT